MIIIVIIKHLVNGIFHIEKYYDKSVKYKLTPKKLIIGNDIFIFTQLLK